MKKSDHSHSNKSQITGWYIQIAGTAVLLFGVTIALGALPSPVNGRLAPDSDISPFLILLVSALVVGFGLTFLGIFYGAIAKQRAKKAEGKVVQVRDLLSKRQKSIGTIIVMVAMFAMLTSIIRFVVSIQQ